jgi:hypothetical protein
VADEWAVTTPKGQVRIADLSLERLEQLEGDTGETWIQITLAPLQSAKVARYVYAMCCEITGAEPVELKARDLASVFSLVAEDLPEVFEGGIPKEGSEDVTPTPGSSGAPDDSTGPQT